LGEGGLIKSCQADLIVYGILGFHIVEGLVHPDDGSNRLFKTVGNQPPT
jgi:hypothetical protein